MRCASRTPSAALIVLLILMSATCGANATGPPTQRPAEYLLRASVLATAGSSNANSQYLSFSTLGQPIPAGTATNTSLNLSAGFWGAYQLSEWVVDVEVPEFLQNLLLQNYPNPFNPVTTIKYSVAQECEVMIRVFDVRGEQIQTLLHETEQPGWHTAIWTGHDRNGHLVASGVYFCHVKIGDYQAVKKLIMMK